MIVGAAYSAGYLANLEKHLEPRETDYSNPGRADASTRTRGVANSFEKREVARGGGG